MVAAIILTTLTEFADTNHEHYISLWIPQAELDGYCIIQNKVLGDNRKRHLLKAYISQ